MSKNFSSIYNIKDYISTTVLPKYFNTDKVNDLNIGLLGMTTELMSNFTEDAFNTITTYLNEMHPNLAILPESIYNQAALFDDNNLFATPAEMTAWLFIDEQFILNNMEDDKFHIDSSMIVDIEGVQFMLDYDVVINVKGDSNFIYSIQYETTRYDTSFYNDLSTITKGTSPYIKSKRIYYNNEPYIAMMVNLHQVTRTRVDETVINNTVLNASSFTIKLDGEIAGFNVFCKLSTETEYVQLEKKMLGSAAVKDLPFCYYRLTDEDELEISFTLKDGYYKPDFGSEIIIEYYSTLGSEGNFDLYTGSDIITTGSSDTYQYNNNMTVFCIPHSDSKYGAERISIDDLKNSNIENFSTVKSYTTENDLQLYFSRFVGYNNVKTYTIKKRDDIEERIFSTFTRYIGTDGDIIRTNTCQLDIASYVEEGNTGSITAIHNSMDDFNVISGGVRYIKPGQLFVYQGNSNSTVVPITSSELTNTYHITIPDEGLVAASYWILIGATRYLFTLTNDVANTDTLYININTMRVTHDVNGARTLYVATTGEATGTRLFYNYAYDFIYSTPYLITLTTGPTMLGYYLNTINKRYTINYKDVNEDSFEQFMCNSLTIKRNSITGSNTEKSTYTITALITPTTDNASTNNTDLNRVVTDIGAFNSDTGEIIQNIYDIDIPVSGIETGDYYITVDSVMYGFSVDMPITQTDIAKINLGKMTFTYTSSGIADEVTVTKLTTATGTSITYTNGTLSNLVLQFIMNESVFTLLTVTSYNKTSNIYTVTGTLVTDDIISGNNFRVTNVYTYVPGTDYRSATLNNTYMVPMTECPITINVHYTSSGIDEDTGEYNSGTVITNVYTTADDMTFIQPLNMVRSNIKFNEAAVIVDSPDLDPSISIDDYNAMVDIEIDSFPLVAKTVIDDPLLFEELFGYFMDQYEYIRDINSKLMGNHTIDLKFYNTYGKSKNFIMENDELIDSVNIGIKFKIKPEYGTDTDDLIRDIKLFIKDYVETINESGGNSIYVSNIIQLIENQFAAVRYMKFGGISGIELYALDNQTIENITADLETLSSEDRRKYVPEYLTISVDDVDITII